MGTNFFTNEKENTLLEKIEGVFKYKKVHFFDALVGYFRASGYFRIRKFIQQTPKIRILVGINVDKLTYQANQQGLLFNPNAEQSQEEFFNDIKRNIQEAKYDKEVEDGMYQFIEDIVTGRITMRIHPKQNIHAKIYIFREEVYHPHGYGYVITGSSNLTEAGLEKNFEFNVELRYDDDIQFATETFEKLWEESVEINITHIDKIKNDSYLNPNFTPYEVYLKFLLEYFGKSIDFDPNSVSDLPTGYKKLSYQIDAVNDGYAKMMKHNGFFLSDVVGLGKTVVSALIAKKFFFSNGFPTHRSHILVIVPPAMKDNWEETLTEFKLDNFKIITNGSLHKVKNPELYDLIIVDEAHKFRSDTASMYNELQKLCKTKTKRYDGSLHDKKVILMSATPLNNRPEDIANLVYLFQDSKDSTLEEGNLQRFFREHIDRYNKLKKQKDLTLIADEVKAIYERIRIKVVEPFIGLEISEKMPDGNLRKIVKPHTYFNEAKLTAIALSVRFALLNIEKPADGRFLALDDMLISLDMSNRAKVVDFLLKISDKYKIYLFTHDKMFFEYFKHKTKKNQDAWVYKEIYMDYDKTPYIRNSEDYLGQAEHYIKQHEYEIAGNFLRKEAEAFCKNFLPKKKQLTGDFAHLDLNGLIMNCKDYAAESGVIDISIFNELDEHRKFILNPSSHDSYDVAKYGHEVKRCLQTLRKLREIIIKPFLKFGSQVEFTLKTPEPRISEYKFILTLCDDFRIIIMPGESPVISKGMINYQVYEDGNNKKGVQSDNTTIKHFFEYNYEKSDKTKDASYLNSVIESESGNPISAFF